MALRIHVHPGSRHPRVTAPHGTGLDADCCVYVAERPIDGRATEAALALLAITLGLPRRCLTLAAGASSRTKLVEVMGSIPPGFPAAP